MLTRVKTTRSLTRALTRPTALLGAGLLAASLTLTGCSGDSTEAYCESLEDAKADIDALDAGDPTVFASAVEKFREVADKAPKEVEDDWDVLLSGIEDIEAAFADAGLEMDQLGDVMTGDIPEGVDMEKLAGLGETLNDISGEEMNDATEAIEEHADEECGITLGEE